MKRAPGPIFGVLLLAIGATTSTGAADGPAQPIAKVAVFADGRIALGGRTVSLAQLHVALADLGKNHGVVWYYREDAGGEPHPNAMAVIKEIIDARLPVSLSTKPDYSTVVGSDGAAHPQ